MPGLSWKYCLLLFLLAPSLSAHNGPPFPIVVDRPIGPVVISLWAHPDVGTGKFFVIVKAPPGGAIPADLKFDLAVRPASGRLVEARYPMQRELLRGNPQYNASVPFDAQGLWNVRLTLESAEGGGQVAAAVEVTPPGFGRWDLLFYATPFLGIAFLYFRFLMQRRRTGRLPGT
jgi:hypothetical protein